MVHETQSTPNMNVKREFDNLDVGETLAMIVVNGPVDNQKMKNMRLMKKERRCGKEFFLFENPIDDSTPIDDSIYEFFIKENSGDDYLNQVSEYKYHVYYAGTKRKERDEEVVISIMKDL